MYFNGKYLKIGIVTRSELLDKIITQYVKWTIENVEDLYPFIPDLKLQKNGCWISHSNGNTDADHTLNQRQDIDQFIVSFLYRNYLRMYNYVEE